MRESNVLRNNFKSCALSTKIRHLIISLSSLSFGRKQQNKVSHTIFFVQYTHFGEFWKYTNSSRTLNFLPPDHVL